MALNCPVSLVSSNLEHPPAFMTMMKSLGWQFCKISHNLGLDDFLKIQMKILVQKTPWLGLYFPPHHIRRPVMSVLSHRWSHASLNDAKWHLTGVSDTTAKASFLLCTNNYLWGYTLRLYEYPFPKQIFHPCIWHLFRSHAYIIHNYIHQLLHSWFQNGGFFPYIYQPAFLCEELSLSLSAMIVVIFLSLGTRFFL